MSKIQRRKVCLWYCGSVYHCCNVSVLVLGGNQKILVFLSPTRIRFFSKNLVQDAGKIRKNRNFFITDNVWLFFLKEGLLHFSKKNQNWLIHLSTCYLLILYRNHIYFLQDNSTFLLILLFLLFYYWSIW